MKVSAHPFGQLATTWEQLHDDFPQVVEQALAESLESVMIPGLREALVRSPDWPTELADRLEVFAVSGGLAVGLPKGDPGAEALEYGGEDAAPKALFRTTTAALSQKVSERFSANLEGGG